MAETLDEFRGSYRYNLKDEPLRRFNAAVAQYVQWDDHEVTNNWFHARILEDPRYTEKRVALLAARAKRAMFEYTPLRPNPVESERVYRLIPRGPLLDLFMLDMRSYRGPNSENRQTQLTDEARILGAEQVQMAQATFARLARDLEGHRGRHAARPGRLSRRRQASGARRRWPRATARRWGASWRSPTS